MKRQLFRLVLLFAVLATACGASPKSNNAGGGTANVAYNKNNGSPGVKSEPTEPAVLRPNNEKSVTIKIKDAAGGKCAIEVPESSENVYLTINKNKVRWEVENECAAASGATVSIENFGKNNGTPFGGDACHNKFVFDPIGKGDSGRLVSRTGKVAGTYPYTIKVVAGATTLAELDPQIVVGLEMQ